MVINKMILDKFKTIEIKLLIKHKMIFDKLKKLK